MVTVCLNAPFGARCFMTAQTRNINEPGWNRVLMHRLALGSL